MTNLSVAATLNISPEVADFLARPYRNVLISEGWTPVEGRPNRFEITGTTHNAVIDVIDGLRGEGFVSYFEA